MKIEIEMGFNWCDGLLNLDNAGPILIALNRIHIRAEWNGNYIKITQTNAILLCGLIQFLLILASAA